MVTIVGLNIIIIIIIICQRTLEPTFFLATFLLSLSLSLSRSVTTLRKLSYKTKHQRVIGRPPLLYLANQL